MGDDYDPGPVSRGRRLLLMNAAIIVIGALMAVAAWASTSSLAVLFGAAIIPLVTIGISILSVVLPASTPPRASAEPVPRTRQDPGLAGDGLGPSSRALLRRARDAIRAVLSSEVCRAGLLDRAAVGTALAGQESDIAAAVRDQARVRARRAELTPASRGPMTAAVLNNQVQAAQRAESSVAARVEALERYAAEVAEADAAYRDWQQAGQLAELHGQHQDMVARTAADEHGIADIEAMSLRARAIRRLIMESLK
jgi:hypothetical protein